MSNLGVLAFTVQAVADLLQVIHDVSQIAHVPAAQPHAADASPGMATVDRREQRHVEPALGRVAGDAARVGAVHAVDQVRMGSLRDQRADDD